MSHTPYSGSRNSRERQKQPTGPTPEQQLVEGIGKVIWWLITLPFKKKAKHAPRRYQLPAQVAKEISDHFNQVVIVQAGQPATWHLAVSEADKLLDYALQEIQVPGINLGERLKLAGGMAIFPTELYQEIWEAHKLRNRLAHEVGVLVTNQEKEEAIFTFKKALRSLGAFV